MYNSSHPSDTYVFKISKNDSAQLPGQLRIITSSFLFFYIRQTQLDKLKVEWERIFQLS